jgi:hypothetical protein
MMTHWDDGVAWMLGLGRRIGGIAGSFLVAEMARANLASPRFRNRGRSRTDRSGCALVKQFVRPEDKSTYMTASTEALCH